VHAILHAHLIPPCPHADLFGRLGRIWLARQVIPDDERAAIERHLRELDRLSEDLESLDREIAQAAICRTTWLRRATSRRKRSVSASGSQISGKKSAARSDASTPASCRTRSDRFAIISRYPRKPTPRSGVDRVTLPP
jgi:hypothetical protein